MLFIFFLGVEEGYVHSQANTKGFLWVVHIEYIANLPYLHCLCSRPPLHLWYCLSVNALTSQQVSVGMIYCHQ